MSNEINFPNANEEQNKILNQIAKEVEMKEKEEQHKLDAEKDKDEFLYLWGHFERRLERILKNFKEDTYQTGVHSLEVTVKIKKKDSQEPLVENFVFNDKLKLTKITEI